MSLDGVARGVNAEQLTASRRRLEQTEQQPDGGRLAGAVRTQATQDLTLLDLEVEILECAYPPEPLREAHRDDGAGAHAVSPRSVFKGNRQVTSVRRYVNAKPPGPTRTGWLRLASAERAQTRAGSRTTVCVAKIISSVSGVLRAWMKPKATSTAISAASTKEQMAPMRAISANTEKP